MSCSASSQAGIHSPAAIPEYSDANCRFSRACRSGPDDGLPLLIARPFACRYEITAGQLRPPARFAD